MPKSFKPHHALRVRMQDRGYDQAYLGKKIGRGETYMSKRMQGHEPWDMGDVYKMVDLLQIEPEMIYHYFPLRGMAAKAKKVAPITAPRHLELKRLTAR